MIFNMDQSHLKKHRKAILEEVVRQKTQHEYPNWEKLAAISDASSAKYLQQARDAGLQDETEVKRIWSSEHPPPVYTFTPATKSNNNKQQNATPNRSKKIKKVKGGGMFGGLFNKKK